MRFRLACGALAAAVFAAAVPVPSATAAAVPGSQGTDTSLPATDSAVTINGRGTYSGLAITINQTKNLNNQAISITWSGGVPTREGPGRFGANYLQIFQCWGDPDGTVADNPGPPPEQCEQGAVGGVYGGGLPAGLYPSGFTLSRVITRSDWPNFDPKLGVLDKRTTNVWMPFRSVDGTKTDIQTDPTFNPALVGGNFWLNPKYNSITTNEIPGAVTGVDGNGAELFQVLTALEAPGLGCGSKVQPVPGADPVVPRCWLVIVPRGLPKAENEGTPYFDQADQFGVMTSPIAPAAWKHRIAIPLEFNPLESPCTLGGDERRLAGAELALGAIASWQPALCASGSTPYSYAPVSDAGARQQLIQHTEGGPGMVAVSQPIDPELVDLAKPLVYAPLSLAGLVIGFNVERNPRLDAPKEEQRLSGIRIASLNLTPRLVAKLLTQSYRQAVSIIQPPDYPWMTANPGHMGDDPDFQRFNPEFTLLQIADGRMFSSLVLPAGTSDAAQQVWAWILADPEAAAWMAGAPDEWGMVVNPAYNTEATKNSTGLAFADPLPNSFPKADSYCYTAPPRGVGRSVVPAALCATDWMPYARSFTEAATITRVAYDGARIAENAFAATSAEAWSRESPQYLGRRGVLALTDTPSAAQFGLQTASLSRAGDNGDRRAFVAPTNDMLVAAATAMGDGRVAGVKQPDPTAAGAYPLTAVTYGVGSPLDLDPAAREDYAAFIDYAAGPGQVPGQRPGQLPIGYAPLPESLRQQAAAAAEQLRTMQPPPDTTTTTALPPASPAPANPDPAPAPRRPTPSRVPAPVVNTPGDYGGPPPGTPPATQATTPLEESTGDTPSTEVSTTTSAAATTTSRPQSPTPGTAVPAVRYAVPGLAGLALVSALGAMEITKRPRRRTPAAEAEEFEVLPLESA